MTYAQGTCGEKDMTLSSATLANVNTVFTVTKNTNAGIETEHIVTYNSGTDHINALGTHTIDYTISFVDYPGENSLTGSFTFILHCPVMVTDDSITDLFEADGSAGAAITDQPTWFRGPLEYDITLRAVASYDYPIVSLYPSLGNTVCFKVETFAVYLKDTMDLFIDSTGAEVFTDSGSGIEAYTEDETLSSSTDLEIYAVIYNQDDPGTEVERICIGLFTFIIIDSCVSTTVFEKEFIIRDIYARI